MLVVDDDTAVRRTFRRYFERQGWQVREAATAEGALTAACGESPDVVLLDLCLPDDSGLQVLSRLREIGSEVPVVMVTGHGDIPMAVRAMQLGAETFLTKPVSLAELGNAVERVFEPPADPVEVPWDALIRCGAPQDLRRIAGSDQPVVIEGETGTGKTTLARRIHQLSPRREESFGAVSAGASALELEIALFGCERAALPGVIEPRAGFLETAAGGTLVIEEVGELARPIQAKLLTTLRTGHFHRIGSPHLLPLDVRLICTTSGDLTERFESGQFRADLYYQLMVLPVRIPPLREWSDDAVVELAKAVFEETRRRTRARAGEISGAALRRLLIHPWPGNVQELRNVLERAAVLHPEATRLTVDHLPPDLGSKPVFDQMVLELKEVERRHIRRVLELFRGNRTQAAEALGISRSTLYDKLKHCGPSDRVTEKEHP